jgi:peptidoglycan-associated lipoprotein
MMVLPALLLVGCESTPEQPADAAKPDAAKAAPKDGSATAGDQAGAPGAATPIDAGKAAAPAAAGGPESMKNVVYFDFDAYDIKPEFRDTVLAHAAYLTKNPSAKLVVEGHCDERGTPEYNIGLGDRRAGAVRQLLKLQGVTDKQVEMISYGEMRPVALGHDENSWWQNRRAVFVYK